MFKNIKIGNRVWDFINKWGTVQQIDNNIPNDDCIMIFVKFDNGKTDCYNEKGESEHNHGVRTLFLDKLRYKIPEEYFNLEEELKKLKRKEFESEEENYCFIWSTENNELDCDSHKYFEHIGCIFFEEIGIEELVKKVNYNFISKKEFEEAFKKAFGE